MNIIKMRQFGSTLTDRADGKKAFQEILNNHAFPITLDFLNVISLGSSFGDEVILKIAEMQNNKITVSHANNVIKNSIRRIVEDSLISVSF